MNNDNVIYSRVRSSAGNSFTLACPFEGNEQAAFNANNLNYGTDNLFQNQGDANNNNIERADVVFRKGLLATPALFFSVLERGVTGGHDPFKIAAITSINAQGFDRLRSSRSFGLGSDGTTNLVASTNYLVLRNLVANQGGLATSPSASVNQPIGGIAISATGLVTANGLGATPGTVIYGYSLFPPDVTVPEGRCLPIPSPSHSIQPNGGIDLIGYTGVVFQAIVPVIEIPTLIIPDGVDIVIPPNLVITTGDIDVPSGTGAITDGQITTPQDLNFNGGTGPR